MADRIHISDTDDHVSSQNTEAVSNEDHFEDGSNQENNSEDDVLCGKCKKRLYQRQRKNIICNQCKNLFHISCVGVSKRRLEEISNSDDSWCCKICINKDTEQQAANISWGHHTGEDEILKVIRETYKEIIAWKKNLFLLPRGKVGRDFIIELTRLVNLFVCKTKWQKMALPLVHIFLPIMRRPTLNL